MCGLLCLAHLMLTIDVLGNSMHLQLDRHDRRPLYMQIVEQIQQHIRTGALPLGSRLPPIRELAVDLGLTRLTVHNAYAELQADGWIESHVGRGTYVAKRVDFDTVPAPYTTPIIPEPEPGALGEVMRLAHQSEIISFAQAAADPATFPLREWSRALQHVMAEGNPQVFNYGMTQGELVLREQLAQLLLDRAVQVPPEHIIVTSGAQQGIDIVIRALVRPNDTILVEQPGYLGVIERIKLQGIHAVGVPMDEEGILPGALEAAIEAHHPRLLYMVPTFQNPTGVSMSLERQQEILAIAKRHELVILEDDIYGSLSYDGPSPLPLKARDSSGLVIYLSSFSKMLMPGIRVGLLAVAPPRLGSLIAAKRLSDLHSPPLIQYALADYLQRGGFAAHLRTIRSVYRERRDIFTDCLRRYFPGDASWTVPHGGFCIWVALPPGINGGDFYAEALERGVGFAPGHAFFPEHVRHGYMRLAFSSQPPEVIERGVAILGELMHTHLARRARQCVPSLYESVPMV
jgi:DNA-binding transcriptional MocR family regulator